MGILKRLTVHALEGARNHEDGIFLALQDQGTLSSGLRLDGPGVEIIVGSCDPPRGSFDRSKTEVIMAEQVLKVFQKVHVLPYKDTFKYNYDYMYHEHLVPYFHTQQAGEFTEGFDFAHEGVRFSVLGVLPEGSYGVVGQSTQIFYEGPPIERKVLERIQLLPYEDGLPAIYRPSRLELDGEGLLRDYLRPYFVQRSAPLRPGDVVAVRGVSFKVVGCRPSDGGGVGRETELLCQGVALRPPAAAKAETRARAKAKGKAAAGAPQHQAQEGGETQSASGGPQCTVS
mmetsp:Transcript_18066/g.56595  ORF Transcript_18066/g.56595 Transcript_18066/m.56595 type:complete len:286 (+) Transcript_18066:3-860(+)